MHSRAADFSLLPKNGIVLSAVFFRHRDLVSAPEVSKDCVSVSVGTWSLSVEGNAGWCNGGRSAVANRCPDYKIISLVQILTFVPTEQQSAKPQNISVRGDLLRYRPFLISRRF